MYVMSFTRWIACVQGFPGPSYGAYKDTIRACCAANNRSRHLERERAQVAQQVPAAGGDDVQGAANVTAAGEAQERAAGAGWSIEDKRHALAALMKGHLRGTSVMMKNGYVAYCDALRAAGKPILWPPAAESDGLEPLPEKPPNPCASYNYHAHWLFCCCRVAGSHMTHVVPTLVS